MELPSESRDRITAAIVETLKIQFENPEFDFDEGELRLIDADETGIFLGLFPSDPETGEPARRHSAAWYIEVTPQPNEGRE